MSTFAVYARAGLVDVTSTDVRLTAANDIELIGRDGARVLVDDVDALVRALRQAELIQIERQAVATSYAAIERIDHPTRKAVFASLAEVYGKQINDDDHRNERLAVLSKLAGHQIHSVSRWGNFTMADGSRVLDVLSTLRPADL